MKRRWVQRVLSIGASAAFVTLAICALQRAPGHEEGRAQSQDGGRRARGDKPARAAGEQHGGRVSAKTAAFDGKVISLVLHGAPAPRLLSEARFDEIGGRTFLVGKETEPSFDIPSDGDVHVAWDSVEVFYLFESIEQYQEGLQRAMEQIEGAVGTVQVRIVDPANRLNGHGGRLAEAVMKRIEETTPLTVCESNADSILSCAIVADGDAPAQGSPYARGPLKTNRAITVEWTDRDGNLHQPRTSVSLREIAPSDAFPELGEYVTTERLKSLRALAAQIVQVVEETW